MVKGALVFCTELRDPERRLSLLANVFMNKGWIKKGPVPRAQEHETRKPKSGPHVRPWQGASSVHCEG